jgi:NAD-dependent dihydropyrimidine dehydrogenase PreA subunit
MQIKIDPLQCNACGICEDICPCDVFRVNRETRQAEASYEVDCWYCGACEQDCPEGAIKVDLPYLIK